MAIRLMDKDSGAYLGDIAREDLQLMIDLFEEESSTDQDYFVDIDTIEMLEHNGASQGLLSLLRQIVGTTAEGVDVRWEES